MADIKTYLAQGGEEALDLVKTIADNPGAFIAQLRTTINETLAQLEKQLDEKGVDGLAIEGAKAALTKIINDLDGVLLENGAVILSGLSKIDFLELEAIYGNEEALDIALTLALLDTLDTVTQYAGIKAVIKEGGLAVVDLAAATKRLIISKKQSDEAGYQPCCFIAGTPVKTPDGYQHIEALKVGDEVLSQDFKTGAIVRNKVIETHIRPISDINTFYKLTIGTETHREALYVTGEHPFWVTDKQQWITVDNLSVGAPLTNHQGATLSVRDKVLLTQLQQTYNITVAGNHNYFAGKLLIHWCIIVVKRSCLLSILAQH